MKPNKAFVLAAGLGTRMRPLTDTIPKPMVRLQGVTLIDHTIDRLADAGVTEITINLHHKGEILRDHLSSRKSPAIHFSDEPVLLDTGGGIKKALQHFGDEAFYVLSGDSYWEEKDTPALDALAAAWKPEKMDILILLQEVRSMRLTPGVGDYYLEPEGRAIRSHDRKGPYMFTSIRINSPFIFAAKPDDTPFSYLDLLDAAQKRGRLYGIVHKGDWHHISTPQDLEKVDKYLSYQKRAG